MFWKWAVELEDKLSDSKRQRYLVWVVPAPFCTMWYTSDLQYREKDEKETGSRGMELRNPDVQSKTSGTMARAFDNSRVTAGDRFQRYQD